jgi:hypothetical protein
MKRIALITTIVACLATAGIQAQVLISDDDTQTADGSSALEVRSTEAGILIPRMSAAERDAIASPARGLMVFVGDDSQFYYYDGAVWQPLGGTGADDDWVISGNTIYREVSGHTLVTIDPDVPVMEIHGHISQTGTGQSVFLGEEAGYNDDLNSNENVFVGYQAGNMNIGGKQNVAIGNQALYNNIVDNNTVVGYQCLYNSTRGYRNTAVGYKTIYSNTTGSDNVAVGFETLFNNTTGSSNVAIGRLALYGNQWNANGSNNVAIGYEALYNNSVGDYNVVLGYRALYGYQWGSQNGHYNIAIGYEPLQGNSSGRNNIALGYQVLYNNEHGNLNMGIGSCALYNNKGGLNNVAVGDSALYNNTSGRRNTALGHLAFFSGNDYTNSTALGYGANITAGDQVRIGNKDVTSIGGFADWTNVSDGRFKKDVKEDVAGLDFIMKLRPVTYHLDMDAVAGFFHTPNSVRSRESEQIKEEETQIGFIAQEVEQAANELDFDFHGVDKPKNKDDYYGLRYAEFVAPLVKAVQEQQKLIEQQGQMIQELKKEVEELKSNR